MPTVNVNIPTPPSEAIIEITVAALQALQTGGDIDLTKWYRVTDATPVPCLVSGASVTESSAFAILEGASDGTGITSVGGTGSYRLDTGVFSYGFVYDAATKSSYIGISPTHNTIGSGCVYITIDNSVSNTIGSNCGAIEISKYCTSVTIGNDNDSIYLGQRCNGIIIGNDSSQIIFEQFNYGINLGENADYITARQSTSNFVFGNNFQNCTIAQGLNGNKADNSGPIDFITGVTFLYNRTSPWEIRDIDRTNELLFLYVTYGDGSDPEEGWYDPSTDTFTPISSGGGVQSVTGDGVDNTDPLNPVMVLGAVATSNDYGDLSNLPTIPAAQIQSDWTQANNAALDFIKNKPTTIDVIYHSVGTGAIVTNLGTRYNPISGVCFNTLTTSVIAALKILRATTFKELVVRTSTTQSALNSLVITLATGSDPTALVDSTVVVTIAAGAVAGEYTSANTIAVPAGHYIVIKCVNNANATSAAIGMIACIGTQTI